MTKELQIFNNVEEVEAELMKCDQASCSVVHSFGPNIYIRQVSIPAKTFTIGHHQNHTHMNVMVKGKVSMKNDDGTISVLTAPLSFVANAGRKIGYVHEDMVWLNIYSTSETDIAKLEEYYLTKSDTWKLAESKHNDNLDYNVVIEQLGYTEDLVRSISENELDMIDLPFGSYKIKVDDSKINGKGLFAVGDIAIDEIIAPARLSGKRTIAGRYTNHSANPNARMIAGENSDIYLVGIKSIAGCSGGLNGEEITINYKDAMTLNLHLKQESLCQQLR